MLGIDTNILVRYIVADDKRQAKIAAQILEHRCTEDQPAYVTSIALVELFWTLRRLYRLSREEMETTLRGLLRAKELHFEHPDEVHYAVNAYTLQGADFADALLGAIGEANGCSTTLTFDKNAADLPEFTHAED